MVTLSSAKEPLVSAAPRLNGMKKSTVLFDFVTVPVMVISAAVGGSSWSDAGGSI